MPHPPGAVPPRLSQPRARFRRTAREWARDHARHRDPGLRKAYGETVALEALDIRVEPGEVFGFLGPNGAGKTTAVKLLLGLTRPDRRRRDRPRRGRSATSPRGAASATCPSCSATRPG